MKFLAVDTGRYFCERCETFFTAARKKKYVNGKYHTTTVYHACGRPATYLGEAVYVAEKN